MKDPELKNYYIILASVAVLLTAAIVLIEKPIKSEKKVTAASKNTLSNAETLEQMMALTDQFSCKDDEDTANYIKKITKDPKFEPLIDKLQQQVVDFVEHNGKVDQPNNFIKNYALVDCFLSLKKNIPDSFVQAHPDLPVSHIKTILNDVSNELEALATLSKDREALKDSCIALATLEDQAEGVSRLSGYIMGQLAPRQYEIVVNNRSAILRTVHKEFQSRGYFSLFARANGTVRAKLKEDAGGFDADVPLYVEENGFDEIAKRLKELRLDFKALSSKHRDATLKAWDKLAEAIPKSGKSHNIKTLYGTFTPVKYIDPIEEPKPYQEPDPWIQKCRY
jgi:hypothetical protein